MPAYLGRTGGGKYGQHSMDQRHSKWYNLRGESRPILEVQDRPDMVLEMRLGEAAEPVWTKNPGVRGSGRVIMQ